MIRGLRRHLIWWCGGSLRSWRWSSGWCLRSCGSCLSGWCRLLRRGRRVVAGVGTGIGRCWPRSSLWRPPGVLGGSCRRCSARPVPPRTVVSVSGAPRGCGPSCIGWCWMSWVRVVRWTGRGVRSIRSVSVLPKGGADGPESCRSRQAWVEDPSAGRSCRTAVVCRDLGRQYSRQARPAAVGAGVLRRSAHVVGHGGAAPPSCTATRVMTSPICGTGCADAASSRASPAAASNPPAGWADIGGWSSARCAPRGALLYPRLSREELGGRFLGRMAYPKPKGERGK
jgi:hypothetical protein